MGGEGGVIAAAVLHMEDQRKIQHMRLHFGVLHIRTQQPQKVFCRGQVLIRTVDIHTCIPLVVVVSMVAVNRQHGHDTD